MSFDGGTADFPGKDAAGTAGRSAGRRDADGLVSVVVPVYNARDFIAATMRSVLEQRWTQWELLLVDDCSTDGSASVIAAEIEALRRAKDGRADRIRLLRKQTNEGVARARNTGIAASQGRYIAFLDADDLWETEKLSRQIAFMKERDAAFSFTSYAFGNADAVPTGKYVHAPAALDFRHALTRTVIFTSTVLFDTDRLEKRLLYMPEIESEDTATWWTILKTGVIAYGLDEALTVYRRPDASLSSDKRKAVRRIWGLYRNIAKLNVPASAVCLAGWAWRATWRRL